MNELIKLRAWLVNGWRGWRARQGALQLLELAALYDDEQPSLAQDLRMAAELALAGHGASAAPAATVPPARPAGGAREPAVCLCNP